MITKKFKENLDNNETCEIILKAVDAQLACLRIFKQVGISEQAIKILANSLIPLLNEIEEGGKYLKDKSDFEDIIKDFNKNFPEKDK